MLMPSEYDQLTDQLMHLYWELDDAIIADITRRLMSTGGDFLTESARHQAEKLQQSGLLYEDIIAEVAKRSGMTQRQVAKTFERAGVQSIRNDNRYYQAGLGTIVKMSDSALQVLNAGYQKCNGNLQNLTLTTANTAQTAYLQACDLAYMEVSTGTMDYQTAVRRAIQATAEQGATVLYPSGHVDKLDVAVRRAVLTGVGQTVRKLSEINAHDMGCDLMEITAHAGARPSHAHWQGQIVSLSGRKGYLSKSDIGYGEVTGFGGVNCRHDWHPFFEGISQRAYSDERLQELENHRIKIGDKSYTDYEVSQMQRRLEREVRSAKRQVIASQTAVSSATDSTTRQAMQDYFTESSVRLKQAEKNLRDFCNQTGFRQDSSRVWVNGFGRSTSQKAVWANRKTQSGAGFGDIFKKSKKSIDKSQESDIIKLESKLKRSETIGTVKEELEKVNPRYRWGGSYKTNCANCIAAYEMRRRGYDVIARPSYPITVDDWKAMFIGFVPEKPDARKRTDLVDDITKKALKWGEGARGTIFIRPEGKSQGHFFSIEVENGKVLFIDAQNNNINAEVYFKNVKRSSVVFGRIDHLDPNIGALRACKNRRKNHG